MRPRDLTRFDATTYDVLVVGGGIHGLAAAYEAASRGLRVALIEAADFGAAASFNHQKTAHGGLRSLGAGDLARAREAIRERRALARIAPWFLRPLPFLVGTYRSATKNRVALAGAFRLDGWLGRHRNDGVEPELHLPKARLVSKAATLRLFPGIRQDRLTGGAQWYDYQMVEADRLTIAFAAAADKSGADLANYTEAVEAIRDGGRIGGMIVRDRMEDRTFEIRARVTLNATGAYAGAVLRMFGVSRQVPVVRAMNLVTSKAASDMALAAPAPDGRMLTLVPWRGRAVIGTSQSSQFVEPEDAQPTPGEIDAFVRDANHAFPALQLAAADISLVHHATVLAAAGRDGPEFKPKAEVLDHARDGAPGAVTVLGVKYTTARAVAEHAVNVAARQLGARLRASRTATVPLPGAAISDHEALAIETARALRFEVPPLVIARLIRLYAEASADIIRLMHERPDLQTAIAPGGDAIAAEIVHVIRHESAVTLADMLIRRTAVGSAGPPAPDAVAAAARIAASELRWNQTRTAEEVDGVRRFYAVAPA